ncbi:MAG: Ldh family oxidoreductase [Candidatus Latescibacteria bacterium]|nr:Ldh family oxidoreductase [Candidatus Latescibacterota bacterium]
MQNARRGRLVATAKEKIVAEGPSWAIIDACDGMPPAISCRAVELAVAKARQSGMCYIGIRGSSHYGAAGFYDRSFHVQCGTLHDRARRQEPSSRNQPDRLRRTHRHRPHRHARHCHQRSCGHQNIRRQKRRTRHSRHLAGR